MKEDIFITTLIFIVVPLIGVIYVTLNLWEFAGIIFAIQILSLYIQHLHGNNN